MVITALNPPDISCFCALAHALQNLLPANFWTAYDAEADVLYINFQLLGLPWQKDYCLSLTGGM